ncbi:MAG: hypothetical protein AAFY60_04975 [Myxococcota bacterium]
MVLNVRPSPSARGALKYFKESLQIGDYLGGSAIEAPIWRGKTADILGLTNKVVSDSKRPVKRVCTGVLLVDAFSPWLGKP